jgi:hypothetical protein
MKLGDIEINPDGIMFLLGMIWFYLGVSVLMIILSIVNAIALYFFDYTITIGGIPL